MAIYNNTLSMIGNTPIVEVKSFDTGVSSLFLKLESGNPGGSIKDRIALTMIEAAERDGKLKKGGTIVEATAGNTGIGLALVAKIKSYNLILVIPDKMSREKINHLKALGAEIVITRSDVGKGHPEYYQDLAEKIAIEKNAFYLSGYNEIFINAQQHIFDRNRLYGAIGYVFNKNIKMEGGYMAQTVSTGNRNQFQIVVFNNIPFTNN